jgi:hypothetical protein
MQKCTITKPDKVDEPVGNRLIRIEAKIFHYKASLITVRANPRIVVLIGNLEKNYYGPRATSTLSSSERKVIAYSKLQVPVNIQTRGPE